MLLVLWLLFGVGLLGCIILLFVVRFWLVVLFCWWVCLAVVGFGVGVFDFVNCLDWVLFVGFCLWV